MAEYGLPQRLLSLWDHLGLDVAHVAGQMPGDIAGLVALAPERVGALALCVPTRLDPAGFASVSDRVLLIGAEHGLSASVTARGATMLPGAQRVVLQGYDAPGWADVTADRGGAVVAALTSAAAGSLATAPIGLAGRSGEHAGIRWRTEGRGPALVLFPFFLAPSQWEPVVSALAQRFTVVLLGGPHLGGVAALEDRAHSPSYIGMVETMFRLLGVENCRAVLDVGCGSGALDRLLAPRLPQGGRITATDLNRFLLAEAGALAEAEGLGTFIRFTEGNAEALSFPDAAFDCAFSVTVLEECDADRALAELVRVVRPGGRVGVIVRAIDLPQFWHLDLPEAIRRKVAAPPQSVGPGGAADASLYRRMRAAGLADVRGFPSLVTLDDPSGPIWRYREDHALSLLDEPETAVWRNSAAAARREELLFQTHAMHCAVGVRPSRLEGPPAAP
jgi:SAM-dependent methyltransferase